LTLSEAHSSKDHHLLPTRKTTGQGEAESRG
jgi:hypothetical protein